MRLNDSDWTPIDGDASDYNFFKVTVEMRKWYLLFFWSRGDCAAEVLRPSVA